MTPFTKFLGALVDLVGAESAAQLTRQFAGQTIHFPITDHYGFTQQAPVIGGGHEPRPASHTAQQPLLEPLCLSAQATQPRGGRLLALAHELGHSSRALQRYAALIEQGRSVVLAEIECLQRDLTGS